MWKAAVPLAPVATPAGTPQCECAAMVVMAMATVVTAASAAVATAVAAAASAAVAVAAGAAVAVAAQAVPPCLQLHLLAATVATRCRR